VAVILFSTTVSRCIMDIPDVVRLVQEFGIYLSKFDPELIAAVEKRIFNGLAEGLLLVHQSQEPEVRKEIHDFSTKHSGLKELFAEKIVSDRDKVYSGITVRDTILHGPEQILGPGQPTGTLHGSGRIFYPREQAEIFGKDLNEIRQEASMEILPEELPEARGVELEVKDKLSNWADYHHNWHSYYVKLRQAYIAGGEEGALRYQSLHKGKMPKKPDAMTFKVGPGGEAIRDSKPKPSLEQLRGLELLEALKSYYRPEVVEDGNVEEFNSQQRDTEYIQNVICKGERYITFKHKAILRDAVNLGLWLTRLNEIDGEASFVETIQDNCNISVQWAYKIRDVSTVFGKYKKLQALNITLTMATKLCKHIDRALSGRPEDQEFWN